MRKLTKHDEDVLVAAYQAWDPAECSAEELARQHDVSRQTMYRVLRRNGVALKATTDAAVQPGGDPAVRSLVARIEELALENAELKRRLAERNS